MSDELKLCEWTNCPTRVGNVCCIERLRALSAQPPADVAAEVDRLRADRDCEKRMRKDSDDLATKLQEELDSIRASQPPAPSVPDGYKLVPVEPTDAMLKAGVIALNGNAVYKNVATEALRIEEQMYAEVYEAMLAAAPPPVRERLTVEQVYEAVKEADLDWQRGWAGDPLETNRYLTLVRIVERALIGGEG